MSNVSESRRLAFIREDVDKLVALLEKSGVVLPASADGTEAWTLIENIRLAAIGAWEIEHWRLEGNEDVTGQ